MKWIKIIVLICIAASLVVFIRTTDFEKVMTCIQQIGFRFSILILVTLIAYLLGTVSWQYCMGNRMAVVSTARLFLIRHIGETVTLINPTSIVGGEAVKAFLLGDYDIEKKTVLASIFLSRGFMVITQLLVFILAATVLILNTPGFYISEIALQVLTYLIGGGLFLVGLLSVFKKFWKVIPFTAAAGNLWRRIAEVLRFRTKDIGLEMSFLLKHHKRKLLLSCVFAILHWLVGSLEFYFILKFLGVDASITQALLVDMGVIFFKTAGAFIPGQIGIEEYGNKLMLIAVGLPGTEIWVTASILRRARQLVWIAFGFGVYFLLVKKTGLPEPCADGSIVCKP